MEDRETSRRRFGIGVATVLSLSLAGCTDSGPGNGGDEGGNESGSGNGNENGNESENGDGNETADNETAGEEETDTDPTLSILLENEDGETVSTNVALEIDPQHRAITYQFSEDIEEGRIVQDGVEGLTVEGGEYVITVESLADEFEPVEETVTVEDEDEEVTITLEGATGDDEAGAENESGEGDESGDDGADDADGDDGDSNETDDGDE